MTKTTTAGTTTYAHDDQDRLLSAVGPGGAESWVYDGHGDLLLHNGSAGQTSFDYETGGQLLSFTKPNGDVVGYELDAGNKRAVKRVNGIVQRQWVYAGGLLPVAELDGSGNMVAVFNGGFMVKNGTTYRLLRDHLGSVRLVVDANTGSVVQRLSYGPWGEVLEDTNPGFQPFGYAGGLYDPDTGLVRFGARDYDPSIGRWTCKDPIGLRSGPNVYAYCGNDPVNFVDRSGLYAEVTVEGNNVTIVLPIEFVGKGATEDVINTFTNEIERQWTGQFGKYNVTTKVITPDPDCPDDKKSKVRVYTKNLSGRSYSSFRGAESTWYSDRAGSSTSPAPHESGHLLGLLKDLYDPETFVPLPGFEDNVMAGAPRTGVTQAQVEEIIKMNP